MSANYSDMESGKAEKMVKSLLCLYDEWKVIVRTVKRQLKYDAESNIRTIIEPLVKSKEQILRLYEDIRKCTTPDITVKRRVDACKSI